MTGTENFKRIKVGVGEKPAGWGSGGPCARRMSEEDRAAFEEAVKESVEAVEMILEDEIDQAMNDFNRKKRESQEIMKTFTQPMQGLKEFEDLEAALPKLSGVIQISGCIDAAKPHMMYSIGNGSGNRIIVTFQEQKAKELAEEYRFLIRTLPIIRQRIFCFTSRISGEMC